MSSIKRVSKTITDKKDIDYILGLKESDITSSLIMDLFGNFTGSPRFQPYDLIEIPAKTYGIDNIKNKNNFTTTIGHWIFNIYFILPDPEIFHLVYYVSDELTKKTFNKIQDNLTYAVMEDNLSIESYKTYLMKTQKFMPYVSILSYGFTETMLSVTEKLNKKKAELLKENKEAVANGDIIVIDKITNELLDYARELLKDDPAMDMFNSGARGSFDNNFKNMFVMRGAVKDPDPTKGYNVITSNYIDGISKEEYSKLANTLSAGPYARAKKTEIGGYWEKLFLAAFQHVILLEPGSDCGTKRYIEMKVNDSNIKDIMYCYVIEGDNLVEITSKNKDRFIGKKIKLRFSSMCESKNGICNKCAGNLFYRLGIRNVGTATPQIPSKLKLLSLKLFHDDQINFTEMDPMHAFGIED